MICFKDKTFCKFSDCANFDQSKCDRAYTEEVRQDAMSWWGKGSTPRVAFFVDKPKCYEKGYYLDDYYFF